MRVRDLIDMDVKPTFEPADLERWTEGRWRVIPDQPVTGFCIDSRVVREGDLFIAINGERADGHQFIHHALASGAAAVMVEHSACLNGMDVPALIVDSTRSALMALARNYRRTLSLRMVAVTGSVGKTTVKELIADMLQHVGITARTRGNWNNDLGMPLSLLHARPDTEYGVFEVGMNHPGELAPLCEVLQPEIGVITCIGPVHIENFENEQGIADEKASVFRALPREGIAVLNADDAYAEYLIHQVGGAEVVTMSSRPGADYVYERRDPARGEFTLFEKASGESVSFQASLPGEYYIIDAVLSVIVARRMGLPWKPIVETVRAYRPLQMRWNRHTWFGVHTVNDAYNANPLSVRAAVRAFGESPVEGARWVVLGGMLELGEDERRLHEELGRDMIDFPELNILTIGKRGAWIAEGAVAAGVPKRNVLTSRDVEEGAAELYERLQPGDTVLFKASRSEGVEKVLEAWKKLKEAADEKA